LAPRRDQVHGALLKVTTNEDYDFWEVQSRFFGKPLAICSAF
jgi:hypothetical protein